MPIPKVILYTKPGCHLCEEVHEVIVEVRATRNFDLEIRNILDDPADYERYESNIPVVTVDGQEIAKYRLSLRRLNFALDVAEMAECSHSLRRESSNSMPSGSYLDQATEYWRAGNPVHAGMLLFEKLSNQNRPGWARRILELVVERTGVRSPPIDEIIRVASNTCEWSNAHDAFRAVRRLVLKYEGAGSRSASDNLLVSTIYLAELVAKVTYNASDPVGPFDEDSGWCIAASVRAILDFLNDTEFSEIAWAALCRVD